MKDYIKKLIVSIVFVVLLIILFLVVKGINENRQKDGISLVKQIIKEKYENVYYIDGSKYIYTVNFEDSKYVYSVFDLSGNKLYSFNTEEEINITGISKNYFITRDIKYHLYDTDYNEITDGDEISPINNYLVKVDDTIINLDNEIVFKDIYSLKLYNDGKLLNINDYYLTDRKGKIIYKNSVVKEEIKSNYITDYLIIKKDDKYYTFFVRIGKIIGDGFDKYIYNNKLYVKDNDNIYRVYKTGFRKKTDKKISFDKTKQDYSLEFENKYKTIQKNNMYYLIDNNNKEILKSKKQIVLYKTNIKKGLVKKEILLYDLKTKNKYDSKKITINKKKYYLFNNTIISTDFKEEYSSKDYLSYFKNTIFYKDKNNIVFKNLKNDKTYTYELDLKDDIFNDKDLNKVIIIDRDNEMILVDLKGDIIKRLKDKKIVDYYEINNKILFIIEIEKNGIKYQGSYLAE